MKRTLCLLLCLVMTALTFASCGKTDDSDKGAIIPCYFSNEITNFDPAYALHDEAATKILGLIYEGLVRMDANGKVQKALAKSWKYTSNPDDDYYMLEVELKNTCWSDGRQVSADDFVFAWKRLLEPEFSSEAASLLYEIKNARAVKNGDMSIDDLGLYAADTTLLQIQFETDIDYELFIERCASIALVPLREDTVVKLVDWASNSATMCTNGPYNVKSYKAGNSLEFERSVYYYRDIDNDALTKYVLPYRFTVDFTMDADAQLAAYEAGTIFYDSDLPLASRAAYADKVELADTLSTHTYVFNTEKAPFDKAEVRRALSLALDRDAIVNIVTYANAAGGFIPTAAFDTKSGTSFREVGGSLIASTADVASAKSLLSSAGVSSGSFTLTIRPNQVDRAVAEYCVGVWEQLGFKVTVKELGSEYYLENDYDQWADLFENAYRAGDFDVIAIDQYSSTDAFSVLSSYSLPFSGSAMDLAGRDYSQVPHVGGYSSEAYDAKIEEAYVEKDRASRATILHDAEKMLVEDMPAIPLFEYQDAYVASKDLSGIKNTYEGYKDFRKTKLKDYQKYLASETEAPVAEETT